MQIFKKIIKLSMFRNWILYTFLRGIVMYVYFEFTVSLKAYNEVQIFLILILVVVIIPRCCWQRQ
jgi:hypothetical protein